MQVLLEISKIIAPGRVLLSIYRYLYKDALISTYGQDSSYSDFWFNVIQEED